MKPIARLTGTILARKGFATPSTGLIPEPGDLDHIVDLDPKFGKQEHTAKPEPRKQPPVHTVAERKPAAEQNPAAPSKKSRRIAMTVRMDEDQHLKLKVYCAHHHKSAQKIIMEAIGNYMARHESDDEMAGCNCFLQDCPDC